MICAFQSLSSDIDRILPLGARPSEPGVHYTQRERT
jgi:hypothetical protein